MIQKCSKKLVLLKTYYYKAKAQDIEYITNPSSFTRSATLNITDKNFNPIENEFINYEIIRIIANNSISGITKKTSQDSIMIKTQSGFVSANTFYFDKGSSFFITVPMIKLDVTASSGELKNAVQVTIEFDNDGTIFSNGAIFARRVRVYGCK